MKIFVGNVDERTTHEELAALFDYAFVHMEREADAKEAIEQLNGKELKGKRINVEMSTKTQKSEQDTNGASGQKVDKNRRASDYQEAQQSASDYDQLGADESYAALYAMASSYDQRRRLLDSNIYDLYDRQRPLSPIYYGRDRSPMRRSPTRASYSMMPSAAMIAATYRSKASPLGQYRSQASAPLAAAYGMQAAAYGTQASDLAAAYGEQASAVLASAFGAQASAALASAYGTQAASTLASAYGTQASTLAASYGNHASSLASAYGTQASALAGTLGTQASGALGTYASQASAYRQATTPLTTSYDTVQLGQQAATYSAMQQAASTEAQYERTRLSPPQASGLDDAYKISADLMKRYGTDRRLTDMSDYRRLTDAQATYRRLSPSSQDYRRLADPHTDYARYTASYSDYIRAAQMQSSYQRRM
ncbi:RNA-binding protein 14 isoform X2 [Microcaecilia unicolor]|uniref:RNA-binding protein 14-like isoform X2 n=1 Tax=Microcaecilia unicolor TaxID=1415580 RepID=A0A6P7ZD55_9AMPH|nr:RNA-binding protein 14-like isoform X2 [Microcaecilia unicolor]